VRRSELEHVLRATATVADDPEILVIGSQSILGLDPHDCVISKLVAGREKD
jgi:hypothetical protein